MDSLELSARLRYLNDSSHLLATSAPITSRYLMSRHNALLLDNEINIPNAQRQKVCGACGSFMILGWEATIEMKRRKKAKCKLPSTRPRAIVYNCGTCNHTTNFPVQPAPKVTRMPDIIPVSRTLLQDQPKSVALTSNQKKRSKAAKHGGLKALLQKKKENPTTSSGFDLMDFMKTTGT